MFEINFVVIFLFILQEEIDLFHEERVNVADGEGRSKQHMG